MIKLTDLGLTYEQAMHGVQTAIKHEMNTGGRAAPSLESDRNLHKHLRVGIDARACDHAACASLLIEKGVITEEEYIERVRVFMNHELAQYETKHAPIRFR